MSIFHPRKVRPTKTDLLFLRISRSDWRLSINLNTLISILADILKAALLLIAAEIISQTKWDWFASRPRPLTDLQKFEDASRSVLGSFMLLFIAPRNMLAMTAAAITILSLAIGPFVQQAAQTVPCTRTMQGTNASLPAAQYVPGRVDYYRIGAGTWLVKPEMNGVLVNGLVNPTGNDSAIVATCPTGNCTFPAYGDAPGITHSSIAMCSSCIDTTRFITSNTGNVNASSKLGLPNGLAVQPLSDFVHMDIQSNDNLSWASSAFPNGFASAAAIAMQNITILSETYYHCSNSSSSNGTCSLTNADSDGKNPHWAVAASCTFYPCMQNFHAVVQNGILQETLLSSIPAPIDRLQSNISLTLSDYLAARKPSSTANFTALQSPCILDNTAYDSSNFSSIPRIPGRVFTPIHFNGQNYSVPADCRYTMDWIYHRAIGRGLSDLFNHSCISASRNGGNINCNSGQAWWLPPLYNNGSATFEFLDAKMGSFAKTVTSHFRRTGSTPFERMDRQVVTGVVLHETTCTRFEWKWLLLPIALILVAAGLLLCMLVRVYVRPGQPIWKNSLLPLVFFGFRGRWEGMRGVVDKDVLEERAGGMRVVVCTGADGDVGFVDKTGYMGGE